MARYELLERIGIGGMAEIFRGIATAGGGFEKPVAIKRILPHLSQDQRFIELLIAEAKILSELHHRNIVQIYDVGLGDDAQYFLVMEFIDGTDLKQVYEHLFDGRRLPIEVALHICSELCEALEHAHNAKGGEGKSLGLVHRDVSPSNVLLSKAGEVKLTDFGIAKRVEEATGHGGVRGKFAYISPEQAVNQHVDARSDVYSVGILLYELVCGQRLFSGLADFDALREVRQGRVRPNARHVADVVPEMAAIIMKALSKEPDDRYPSAGEFGSALRGYRYSLETDIADPAAEIAALVLREGRGPSRDERADSGTGDFDGGNSTIVRIDTAAEFNLTDLSGLHQLVTSFPEPKIRDTSPSFDIDSLDDEKTTARANPLLGLGDLGDATVLQARPTPPVTLDPSDAFHDRLLPGVGPSPEDDALVEATVPLTARPNPSGPTSGPTNVPPPKSPKSMFPDAALPRPGRKKPVAPLPALEPVANARPNLARAETPTERDVFHSHAMKPKTAAGIPEHYPGYSGRPAGFLDAEAQARRRRMRMGLIAGALAVLAFVIAGHFLGGDDAARADRAEPDGGPIESLADAAPALVPSVDASVAVETPPKRVRKKRPRRKKRNTRKKNRRK
jgi:serine/threonine protein kinase